MPRPYSQEMRERVIGAVAAGSSAKAAGRLFGVSASAAAKWVQEWRRIGRLAAKPMGGDKRSPLDPRAQLLLDLIDEHSDLTVEEIRTWLRTRGIRKKRPHARGSVVKEHNVSQFDFKSHASARHAAYCGFVAAIIVLGISAYQVLKAIAVSGIDPSRNWAGFAAILMVFGLQFAAIVGLYHFSRIAAFGSFVIFLTLALVAYLTGGFQSSIVSIAEIVLLLTFIHGIRGTFAYHRLLKQNQY